MKVLIVGMNPSNKATKGVSGSNSTFRKLESWMSSIGVHYFSFINTFDEPGEAKQSSVDLVRLASAVKQYDKVIALGGFPSRSLNMIDVEHFKLPHPSPRNRQLNDKRFEIEQLKLCEEYVRG